MQTEAMIVVNEFCIHHNIDTSFINLLNQSGLIETIEIEDNLYLHEDQLPHLERMVRLYYELDINLEGIETIVYLLGKMEQMQQDTMHLKNRLAMYENNDLVGM